MEFSLFLLNPSFWDEMLTPVHHFFASRDDDDDDDDGLFGPGWLPYYSTG